MSGTGDQFRDSNSELKIIAYLIRKDHRLCNEISRDIFSIKAYKMFFDIVSTGRTTFPKDVFKSMVNKRVKNPELVNPYLIKLFKIRVDNVSNKNAKTIIDRLKKLYAYRFSLEKTDEIIESVEKDDLDKVKKTARQIASMGVTRKRIYTGEYLKDYEKRKAIIKMRIGMSNVGIPTGIKQFDKVSGGLMKGELGILIGESAIGKSIGLENFALNAWELNYNVAYFSIEMSKDVVGFRADSNLMKLKYRKFRLGQFTKDDLFKWEKGIKKYRESKNNFFEIVSLPRSCNASELETEMERIQDQYGQKLDLAVVDYLNIMRPNSGGSNPKGWESQVDIAWDLKEIATDFQEEGVAVWTGNQVTDEAEQAAILRKRHVKYGRGIVEVANIIVGLIQTEDNELEDLIQFQTVKLRDLSKIPMIILRPNFDLMMLNDERIGSATRSLSKEIKKSVKKKVKVRKK